MTDLINALSSFCSFCISQLTAIANFFTSSTLGQFILGIVLITLVCDLILHFIKR